MTGAEPIAVYGDSISGNCQKVRIVCQRLGIPFRWIETSVIKGDTRKPEFRRVNPVGQVPVIVLPDGRALAQSNAIMRYLAEGSALIPADRFERALMDQWLFWEQYSHEPAIAVLRFHRVFLKKPESEIDPALKPRCERALAVMENHLGARRFFVAESPTLADIALVAYTRMGGDAGLDLAQWPAVTGWIGRVEAELGLEPYRPVSA